MSTGSDSAAPLYESTKERISEHGFKIVTWVGVAICVVVCVMRFCIRFVCFRRLFVEDFVMLVAMAILIAIAVLLQHFLGYIYEIQHVQNRLQAPGPSFPNHLPVGLGAIGIIQAIDIVGLWLIKLNFMLLFYRIGYQIRSYLILWWVALVAVVGCGAVNLSLIPYDCDFGSLLHITVSCAMASRVKQIYTRYIVGVVIDVFSDLIIICFPVLIVWKTGVSWRQKLVLSSIFLLVSFTIAITIVRGSIFGGTYKSVSKADRQVIDSSWVIFWFLIEYFVSFIIACLVSFRSLWSSKNQNSKNHRYQAERQRAAALAQQSRTDGQGDGNRTPKNWRKMHDDFLDTLADLEGTTIGRDKSYWLQIPPHLATIDIDFLTSPNTHSDDVNVVQTREEDRRWQGDC